MTTRAVVVRGGKTEAEFMAAVTEAGGGDPRAIVHLEERHRDGCPKLDGGACRCDPDQVALIRWAVTP